MNCEDHEGMSPLCFAAQAQRCGVAKRLLAHGADVEHRRLDGATALCLAAHEGHGCVVQLLLEAGAEPEGGVVAPLLLAVREGNQQVVRSLCAAEMKGCFHCVSFMI